MTLKGNVIRKSLLNIPKRYYIMAMLFLEYLFYALTNTSIVIVDLTSNKTIEHDNGTIEIKEAEYNWTSSEVGIILSMNAVGHFFSGFMGITVNKLGGVTSLSICKAIEALVSFTGPFMINTNIYLFYANRFALGFAEGFGYISCMDVYTHWAPPDERVRFVTYVTLGLGLGNAITYPVSGFIIQNLNWRYLFYVYGFIVVIWNLVWLIFVSNDPSTDKFITVEERINLSEKMNYISKDQIRIPYRSIFTSIPIYALLNEFFISMFTITFMYSLLPLYVKDTYNASVQIIGLISGIPELTAFIIQPLFAYIADYFRSKPNYTIGKVHKTFLFWGQSLTLVFFFITAFWNHLIGCIICLTLARVCFSISQISYNVILIDVCGQYAAFMRSISVFFLSTAHFINPVLAGFLVPNHSTSEWNTYFLIISFLTMYGVIVFLFFGSGDLQPWAMVAKPQDEVTEQQRSHGEIDCEKNH